MLVVLGNLAVSYSMLGRDEDALRLRRDVHAGTLKLLGGEHESSLIDANNLANVLIDLERFEEAKSLMRKTIPVARRVLGESNDIVLMMRLNYANAVYLDNSTTLDDLREAVSTLEDTERIARRVLGGAHPLVGLIGRYLRDARAAIRAREAPSGAA